MSMIPPYYILPDIDALDTAPPERREALVRKLAACIGDECTLRSIIGLSPDEFRNFYPDMLPRTLSTDDTISSFINIFSSEKKAATPTVETLVPETTAGSESTTGSEPDPLIPVTPAIDYALTLDTQDESDDNGHGADDAPADSTSDLINSFLQAVPPKTPSQRKTHKPEKQPQPVQPGPSFASLTDAVKNKDYQQALEIIQELSLNNPKKSVYFATQTRFIKKLMQIESNRRNSGM